MKKGYRKHYLIILISFVLIAAFVGFLSTDQFADYIHRSGFIDNGMNGPYARGVPLHEMDFGEFEDRIEFAKTAYKYYPEISRKVILPCDVEYYNRKEDEEPALVLKKGEEVWFFSNDVKWWPEPYYGISIWPDYEKGWRYGVPFISTDISRGTYAYIIRKKTRYYVREEQLRAVAEGVGEKFGITAEDIPWLISYIDRKLYEEGEFCAPRVKGVSYGVTIRWDPYGRRDYTKY